MARIGRIVFLCISGMVVAFSALFLGIKALALLFLPLLFLMIKDPKLSFYLTVASTITGYTFFLNKINATVNLSFPKILGFITLIALLIHHLWNRKTFKFGIRLLLPFSFVLFSAFSLLYSPVELVNIKNIVQLLGSFSFFFLAINIIEDRRDFHRFLWVLTIAFTLLAIFSIVQYFLPSSWTDEYSIQSNGVYQAFVDRGIKRSTGLAHPGILSFILVMLIPYIVYLFLQVKDKKIKWIPLICLGICITATLMTHTRAGVLCLVVIAILVLWKKIIKIPFSIQMAMIPLGLIGLMLFMPKSFMSRVLQVSDYLEEGSVQIRLENQRNAFSLFYQNPIGGIGSGNFERFNNVTRLVNREVTNTLLEIAVELGMIGVILALAAIGKILKDTLLIEKSYRRFNGVNLGSIVLISVAVSLVSSFFMNIQDFREWWLFMSIPTILFYILKKERNLFHLNPVTIEESRNKEMNTENKKSLHEKNSGKGK